MNWLSQYFCLARASSVTTRYGLLPIGQQVWVEPGNGGDHLMWPTSFIAARSVQSMMEMPPPHQAQYMRLPRMVGGPCSVVACSFGCGSLPTSFESVFIHGRPQIDTTSGRI